MCCCRAVIPSALFEDANLDDAVDGAVLSKFRHSGQTCVSTNRFLVHSNVHDAFAERLVRRVKDLKVGNGLEPEVDIGPLINEKAVAKVERLVSDAMSRGGLTC